MTAPTVGDAASSREARAAAWIAVVALLAGLGFAPPWQRAGDIPEGFAGRLVAGVLERADDGGWTSVSVGELVPEGSDVRSSGGAQLAVAGGGLALAGDTEVELSDPLALASGELLVEVEDRQRQVVVGPLLAVGRGTWRVDAAGAPRVAVYDGGVAVRPADARDGGLPVGRLHQADLAGDVLPEDGLPLRYEVADPWDARLLVDALEVDRQAAQLQRSLRAQHGDEPRPESFYRSFTVVDAPVAAALGRFASEQRGDDVGPPADVLVHVVVVDLLRTALGLDADTAIERVETLRRAGATWGVVLALHDLDAEDLRAGFDLSVRQGSEPAASAPAGSGGGTTPDVPSEPGDGEPPPEPSPSPSDEPVIPCEGEPCDEANDLADDLLDLIDDIVPGDEEDDDLSRDEARELREELREERRDEREEERERRGEELEQEREEETSSGRGKLEPPLEVLEVPGVPEVAPLP